jgi:hypothetical protein
LIDISLGANTLSDEQIIFIHIPKTAGTTLRDIIFAQYGETSVAPIYPEPIYMDVNEFKALADKDKKRARAIIGHIGFGFHTNLGSHAKFSYATFVRDPMRRCVSLYNHLRNAQFKGKEIQRDTLIGTYRPQFNNMQTRLISGSNPQHQDVTEGALDLAIENIEKHFSFVGVTERFDESFVLATFDLGWKLVAYDTRNTASQWAANFSEDLSSDNMFLDRLMELNQLDRRLYEYVDGRLTDRLTRLCPGWQARLDDLQRVKTEPVATDAVGNLGKLRPKRIVGWAKLRWRDRPARLKITINDNREFTVDAVLKREDLRPQQFSGACGFSLTLPRDSWLKPGDVVNAVVVNAGNKELNNSPRVFEAS